MTPIAIAHLYPGEMNIYGDWGNIITLRKRLQWRGMETEYVPISLDEDHDFTRFDIVFGGGGQDKGQVAVAEDLQRHRDNLHKAIADGVVFVAVCGIYQLFGRQFTTSSGSQLPGVGVFDAETVGSDDRLIGNIVVQTEWGELVGFENHSGKTRLATEQSALGRVVRGHGNNGDDRFEGALTHNVFGTYLHGPLLPKNPVFTDEILRRALKRRGIEDERLVPLDDELARQAAEIAKQRPQ